MFITKKLLSCKNFQLSDFDQKSWRFVHYPYRIILNMFVRLYYLVSRSNIINSVFIFFHPAISHARLAMQQGGSSFTHLFLLLLPLGNLVLLNCNQCAIAVITTTHDTDILLLVEFYGRILCSSRRLRIFPEVFLRGRTSTPRSILASFKESKYEHFGKVAEKTMEMLSIIFETF